MTYGMILFLNLPCFGQEMPYLGQVQGRFVLGQANAVMGQEQLIWNCD